MEIKTLTRKLTQDNFATEAVDVIQNNLLGFYDDNGEYCITPQIMEELVALPKTKKSNFHNSLFCVGNLLGFGEIAFEIDYDKKLDENEFAKATLYVLEEVDKINGYLQNTLKTKVGEFENSVDDFMEQSYKHFNVSLDATTEDSTDEGMERKILDDIENQDSFILAKKQFTLQLDKLANEKCLDAYGKYFTFRYSALTKMNNAFSQAVIELFEEEYARIEKFFLKDKNYKMLNELLDKCIEEVSGTSENYIGQEKEYNDMIAQAMENFSDSIKALHEKLGNKALNMLDKDDREKMEDLMEAEDYHNKHNDEPIVAPIEPVVEAHEELVEEETLDASMEDNSIENKEALDTARIVPEAQGEAVSSQEDKLVQDLFTHVAKNNSTQATENENINETVKPETQVYVENKILDTNRTNDYDESMKEDPTEDAVSNLHASVGRLSALTSKADNANEQKQELNQDASKEITKDDFVHSEVASYLNDKVQTELPPEKVEEIKAKPRSFEQLFNYLNEQNKIKNDEIALRNQRNRELHDKTQENDFGKSL